jgi:hypothetical protein
MKKLAIAAIAAVFLATSFGAADAATTQKPATAKVSNKASAKKHTKKPAKKHKQPHKTKHA